MSVIERTLKKVNMTFKDTYNNATRYVYGDVVTYNGSSYVLKVDEITGQAPTNTTYWQLSAKQGEKPVYQVDYLTNDEMAGIINDIITDSTNAFNQNVTAKTTAFNNNATDKTTAFNNNATSKTGDFNSNASSKTTAFNNNATDKTSDYNTNASSTKDDFDRNASSKTTTFNDNATSKTNSYNSNATDKTTAYNNNHTDKLGAYNDNASAKTTAFNENASEKTTEFNNNASALQEELDRYKTLENAMPHVTGTGESITLNDTANSPMNLELEPTELSQASTPTPDNPQEIHTISGDNEIKVENKNLLQNNATSQTINNLKFVVNNDKTITVSGTPNANTNYTILGADSVAEEILLLKANTTYYNSTGIRLVYRLVGGDYGTINSGSFTPNNDLSIRHIYLSFTSGTSENATYYPMISLGSTATTYVPHQEQVAQLNLGDLEYCKIGDYKDRFFKNIPSDADYDATRELGKWYLKKNIGKVVLDGSESGWHTSGLIVSGYKGYYVDSSVRINQDALGSKCNYFEYKTSDDWQDLLEATFIENAYQTIGIRVAETLAPTLEDFKIWLSTHNTIAYFVLATPTYTLLNNTLQSQLETIYNKLLGYQEQTNISQANNDLPFNINAKAVYDLNKLVERVTELENE